MCKKSLKDCTLLKDSNSHQTKCFTRISVLQTWIRLTHSFVRRGICQMFYVSKIPIILSSYSFTQADFVTLVTNFTSVFVNILILKHDVLQVFYIGFLCWFHSCFSQKDLLFWTCWSSWAVQCCCGLVPSAHRRQIRPHPNSDSICLSRIPEQRENSHLLCIFCEEVHPN